ncbi:hypothetical protein PV08_11948 [Exophiala spinifera]|uniref:Zn(2)-C6 fungal-type domain-containing protein n=1 Tax=Exophiala spinifera TaxID=91928 RepID=A0A0D1Z9Z7_9EURO|nr:uncharacterized protein PV08_11948 [Exophiala spinifera]KIW09847.1 hypothetical protein PV08_11948 [Exophiala spinifera]
MNNSQDAVVPEPNSPPQSAMQQSERSRTKKWAPKTFNGCLTCKKRRIKCDEGKPFCQRCLKSNFECGGYAPPKIRLFEPTGISSPSSSSAGPSSIAPSPLPGIPTTSPPPENPQLHSYLNSYPHPQELALVPSFGTEDEYRSFQFFIEKTASLISVYSQPYLWTVVLPQATWQQAAIKHSVIALANLHQSLTASSGAAGGSPTQAGHDSVVTHYNAAIRALLTQKPPIDVVLVSCVIFWSLENFNGSEKAAFDHMKAAIKILGEWKTNKRRRRADDPAHDLISTYIEPTIRDVVRFAPVARLEELEGQIKSVGLSSQDVRVINHGLGQSFETLKDASTYLSEGIADILSLMALASSMDHEGADVPPENVVESVNELDAKLYKWINLFQKLTSTGPVRARRMLVVHHVSAYILLDLAKDQLGMSEEEVPQQLPRCRWSFIVNEVEDMLKHGQGPVQKDKCSRLFASLGIIPPMFLAATSAPNAEIRRRATNAIRLMSVAAEGPWNSEVAAKIADAMLEILSMQRSLAPSDVTLKQMRFGVDTRRSRLYLRWNGENHHVDKEMEIDEIRPVDPKLPEVIQHFGYCVKD